MVNPDDKVHNSAGSSFLFFFSLLVNHHYAFFYLKILENFIPFKEGFCFVLVPFGRMVKFEFLVQFPIDHIPHPVLYSFYASRLHLSVITKSIHAILLGIVVLT